LPVRAVHWLKTQQHRCCQCIAIVLEFVEQGVCHRKNQSLRIFIFWRAGIFESAILFFAHSVSGAEILFSENWPASFFRSAMKNTHGCSHTPVSDADGYNARKLTIDGLSADNVDNVS
jgi:hypothetical protein